MSRKPYKGGKRGRGRFVQLDEYMQKSPAWATMKPGPRALYIELKRRYNGRNNGKIFLSQRDAAKAINVHRNTVCHYFRELVERGFIRLVEPHALGPSGIGKASVWALEELPLDGIGPGPKAFMRWPEKQKPRTKMRPPRHKKQDDEPENRDISVGPVLKIVT